MATHVTLLLEQSMLLVDTFAGCLAGFFTMNHTNNIVYILVDCIVLCIIPFLSLSFFLPPISSPLSLSSPLLSPLQTTVQGILDRLETVRVSLCYLYNIYTVHIIYTAPDMIMYYVNNLHVHCCYIMYVYQLCYVYSTCVHYVCSCTITCIVHCIHYVCSCTNTCIVHRIHYVWLYYSTLYLLLANVILYIHMHALHLCYSFSLYFFLLLY